MRNVEIAMRAAGVGWDDIVRRTIYTLHPTEYEVITRAIDEVTGGADASGADDRRDHRASPCPAA